MKLDSEVNEKHTFTFNRQEIIDALFPKIKETGKIKHSSGYDIKVFSAGHDVTHIELVILRKEQSGEDYNGQSHDGGFAVR